jgi:hypothetical protein
LPLAWLEVEGHRVARTALAASAEVERVERLGHVFSGVSAPAAIVQAKKRPQGGVRSDARPIWDDRDPFLHRVEEQMARRGQRLKGRVRFVLGIVTGCNRDRLGSEGEPILRGRDISSFVVKEPTMRLAAPFESLQQMAPVALYRRPKLIYRFIAAHPVAAVDRAGRLILNSANAMVATEEALDLDFIGAILNSSPVRLLHEGRVRLPRVLRSHLESVWLPAVDEQEMRSLAERVRALPPSPGEIELDELDERVMDLYGFSEVDRRRMRRRWP